MKLFNWVNKKLKPGINPAPAPVATYDLGRLQAKDGSSIGKKQQLGWQKEELHRSRRELQSLFGQEELVPKPGINRYPCGNASSLLAIGTLGAMQEEEAEGAGFDYLSGGGDGSGGGGDSGGAIMTESELLELQEALQRALLAAASNVQAEKLPAATSAVATEKVPASSGGKAVDDGEATKKAKKKAAAKTKKEASAAANLAKKVGMATLTDNKNKNNNNNNNNSSSSNSNSNSNIPANNLFKKQSLLHRFSKACSKKVNPPTSQAKLSTADSDMKYWRSDHQPSKSILNWKNVHPPSTHRSKKPPPPTTISNATSASVSASAHRSKLAKFLQAFRKGKKSQVCPAPSSSSMLQQHISSGAQAGAGYGHARLSAFERRGADYPISDYALDVLGSQMRLQLRNGREDNYSNEEEEEEEEDGSAMADDMGAFCDEYAYHLRRHHHYNEEDEEEEEDMEMEMDDLDYTIQWLIKNDQEYWIKTDDEYVVLEL